MMESLFQNRLIVSGLLVAFSYLLKYAVARYIRSKSAQQGSDKRYLINNVKNLINLILILAILAIWSPEIQKFALSVAAFVVAIVIATKELIQNFIGFIYLSSTQPYRVGDWVQVGDTVGEVSETDWMKVTMLEIDITNYSYTGRTVFIPNNQMLAQVIKNLNYMRRYVNHQFVISQDPKAVNPYLLKQPLLEKATLYCDEFKDVAQRYNNLIEKRLDVKISGPEPSLKIATSDLGKFRFSFSVFCPTSQAKSIEQKIVEDFFSLWHKLKEDPLNQQVGSNESDKTEPTTN
jgi:small-conductance mechanosensitive channel